MQGRFRPIFDPAAAPVRGMRSYPDPLALGDGEWQLLKNVRWDDRTISRRPGITALTASLSGTFIGGTLIERSGNLVAYAAMSDSGLKVHYNVFNGSTWGGWVEQTAGTGQWGNTRQTAVDKVWFAALPGYFGTSALLMQGADKPLYLPLAAGSGTAVLVNDISPPPLGYAPVAGMNDTLPIGTGTAGTPATTGTGNLAWTVGGSSPNQTWLLTFGSGYAANDTASLALSSGTYDFTDGAQAVMLLDFSESGMLDHIKIELWDGSSNYYTVHDPVNGLDARVVVEATSGVSLVAFPTEEHSATNVRGLRVTATSARVSTGATVRLRTIMCSGNVPGTAQYMVSFTNVYGQGTPYNAWESPGVVLRFGEAKGTTTERTTDTSTLLQKGPSSVPSIIAGVSLPTGFELPIVPEVYYKFTVPVFAPNSTDGGRGVSTYNVYRRDPGEDRFFYVGYTEVAEYSGGWQTVSSVFGSTSAWEARGSGFVDTVRPEEKILEYVAPDGQTVAPPPGGPSFYADSRLFLAAKAGSGSDLQYNGVWLSWQDAPLRFRAVADLDDPDSGYSVRLGSENVTAIQAVSSSSIGRDSVYVFTDRALYSLLGRRVSRIASKGSVSGVVEEDGAVYFMDQDFQLGRLLFNVSSVSRYQVDDLVLETPEDRREFTSLGIFRDRVYVSLASSTSDNNYRVLVLNNSLGAWESIDEYPVTKCPQQFVSFRLGGDTRICFFAPNGILYQLESGDDDDGASVTMEGRSRSIHTPDGQNVTFNQLKAACTSQDTTVALSFVTSRDAATKTGTFNADASPETVARDEALDSDGDHPSVDGLSGYVKFSVTPDYPFKFHNISAMWSPYAGTAND